MSENRGCGIYGHPSHRSHPHPYESHAAPAISKDPHAFCTNPDCPCVWKDAAPAIPKDIREDVETVRDALEWMARPHGLTSKRCPKDERLTEAEDMATLALPRLARILAHVEATERAAAITSKQRDRIVAERDAAVGERDAETKRANSAEAMNKLQIAMHRKTAAERDTAEAQVETLVGEREALRQQVAEFEKLDVDDLLARLGQTFEAWADEARAALIRPGHSGDSPAERVVGKPCDKCGEPHETLSAYIICGDSPAEGERE